MFKNLNKYFHLIQAAFLLPELMDDHYKTEHDNELTFTKVGVMASREEPSISDVRNGLGCSFPVKYRFVYAISANIFGKAD